MNPQVERFLRGLQSRVEIGPGKFIVIRRPLPGDYVEMGVQPGLLALICAFTVSWDGLTDLDIFTGGDATPTPFDGELFAWWIKDHPEYWGKISKAIDDSVIGHDDEVAEAVKK